MMKTSIFALFILWIVLCNASALAQDDPIPEIKLGATYLGPYRIIVGETNSMPPCPLYRTIGQDFTITVIIVFPIPSDFKYSLFGIVCVLPDHTVQEFFFDSQNITVIDLQQYQYTFPIRIQTGGWLQVYIVRKADIINDSGDHFFLNTSNKESIYLESEK